MTRLAYKLKNNVEINTYFFISGIFGITEVVSTVSFIFNFNLISFIALKNILVYLFFKFEFAI